MVAVRAAVVAAGLAAAGCSTASKPIDVHAGDTCAHCRMAVSNARFAGQIVAPGEEPLFYDDIGCLAKAVEAGKPLEFAFVADHRTGEWVPARSAVFTHVPAIETPMGSSLMAHANDESRRADRSSSGGNPMTSAQVFEHAH